MDELKELFLQSEGYLKQTLQVPKESMYRLERNVMRQVQAERPKRISRVAGIATAIVAVCAVLTVAGTQVVHLVQQLASPQYQMHQGAQNEAHAFPLMQESAHFQLKMIPTGRENNQDTYDLDLIPKEKNIRIKSVELVGSFQVSGEGPGPTPVTRYQKLAFFDNVKTITWKITFDHQDGVVQTEQLVFAK